MSKPTYPNGVGLGSLATGAVTAAALAVQTGLAAVVGVIIAREFGRTAETDGFFAAYGVFVVLALAATAIRVTVLPRFARARRDGRLSGEVVAVTWAVSLVAVPLVLLCVLARAPIAALLTGFGPPEAQAAAEAALPWMGLAAAGQLAAGILASAFAALDDYVVPAVAYIAGSVAGLALILLRVEQDGIIAIAWGVALNASVATAIAVGFLGRRAARQGMPSSAVRVVQGGARGRLVELGCGTAVPFALQAVYLLCLPIAARSGIGSVTSFGYAYLIGSAVVSVTASSLGLVTSVPLARIGLDPARVARHVDAASWIAVLAIGATVGVFWLAGQTIVAHVLGAGYGDDVGSELGNLVVALAPWMVASVGVSVTFPLVFVGGRIGRLPVVAAATLVIHVPLVIACQALAGLTGVALALAASTAVALVLLLVGLDAVRQTLNGMATPVAVTTVLALAGFVPAALLIDDPAASAAAGLAAFGVLVALVRPRGLGEAWTYLRGLA